MSALVDLYNQALGLVGSRTLLTATTDNIPAAESCNLYYPLARDYVFEHMDFVGERRTVTLALVKAAEDTEWLADDPLGNFAYHYAMPAGAVFIENIFEKDTTGVVEQESRLSNLWEVFDTPNGQVIGTDIENAVAICHIPSNNIAAWPAAVKLAVIHVLANFLAANMAKQPALAESLLQRAEFFLDQNLASYAAKHQREMPQDETATELSRMTRYPNAR